MVEFQSNASIVILILFIALLISRALLLRRKGIKVLLFGKTDKSDFLLVVVILLLIYPAVAKAADLPVWDLLVTPFWETPAPGWAGLAFCAAALVGFGASLKSFGDSLRVGLDVEKPGRLVTGGMFAVSRNPLYMCFILFCAGMFLVHRNIVAVAAVVVITLAVHRQILREEAFLKKHYGAEYEDYCKRVRRYL